MNPAHCLPDPALWPALSGAVLAPEAKDHLEHCALCSARIAELDGQRRQLLAVSHAGSGGSSQAVSSKTRTSSLPGDDGDPCKAAELPFEVAAHATPAHIGKYRIERLLKLGGQAAIYLARHPEDNRDIVIKCSHAPISRRSRVATRFADEARLLAELRHPNLCRVLDLGIAESRPFLVLEYIAGRELSGHGAAPIAPHDAARLIATVSRALHAVHQAGRLHLDIQPDNILIDIHGCPHLIDFGLAAPLQIPASLTETDLAAGTPEYMSPEQLAGETDRFTPATDIYALAAVLHELLTGSAPQPELVWMTRHDARRQQTTARPARVPRALLQICLRALNPDPSRRFSTALEFAAALERHVDRKRPYRAACASGALAVGLLVAGTLRLFEFPHTSMSRPADQTQGFEMQLASTLRRLLNRSSDSHAALIFSDGRELPIRVHSPPAHSATPRPDFIDPLAHELTKTAGTWMLLVVACADPDAAIAESIWPAKFSLPLLPPGTLVRITNHDILGIARSREHVPGSAADRATRDQLRRLQMSLARTAGEFDAVIAAAPSGAGT